MSIALALVLPPVSCCTCPKAVPLALPPGQLNDPPLKRPSALEACMPIEVEKLADGRRVVVLWDCTPVGLRP